MDGKGEQFDCESCTRAQREKRGHDAGPWWSVGRYRVNCCPQRYVTSWHIELLRVWRQAQRGHLPYAGGWLEQPAELADMLTWLEAEERVLRERHDE